MKLQIKTLNQKSLIIDIEETKTVYDLKKELSLYPDVGVKPELQKLIYAGKILNNDDQICAYNIDVKKFLVIMILKQPLPELPVVSKQPDQQEKPQNESTLKKEEQEEDKKLVEPEFKAPPPPAAEISTPTSNPQTDAMVEQITAMGYPEQEVRRALRASFNNPERAIEYLIEGIPTSPSTPEGESNSEDPDLSMTPFEIFRRDPMFRNLRDTLQEHPELIEDVIQSIGETNPSLLELINENSQEFLNVLIGGDDGDDFDDEDDEDEDSS